MIFKTFAPSSLSQMNFLAEDSQRITLVIPPNHTVVSHIDFPLSLFYHSPLLQQIQSNITDGKLYLLCDSQEEADMLLSFLIYLTNKPELNCSVDLTPILTEENKTNVEYTNFLCKTAVKYQCDYLLTTIIQQVPLYTVLQLEESLRLHNQIFQAFNIAFYHVLHTFTPIHTKAFTEEFVSLPFSIAVMLLEHDHLACNNENSIYQVAKCYCAHNKLTKKQLLQLFKCIRFPNCTPEFLLDIVFHDTFFVMAFEAAENENIPLLTIPSLGTSMTSIVQNEMAFAFDAQMKEAFMVHTMRQMKPNRSKEYANLPSKRSKLAVSKQQIHWTLDKQEVAQRTQTLYIDGYPFHCEAEWGKTMMEIYFVCEVPVVHCKCFVEVVLQDTEGRTSHKTQSTFTYTITSRKWGFSFPSPKDKETTILLSCLIVV